MRDLSRSQIDISLFLVVTISIVLIDRVTKLFITDFLSFGESLPVIRGVLHMTLVHNTGIAFGFLQGKNIVLFIFPVLIILLAYNFYYYKQNNAALSHIYIFAFSLILGGAIGNLYDRINYGYVIDFIDFRVWPVFNIADSAITIGAFIIALKCFQLSAK